MLRWTTRLREVLANRGCGGFSKLREAEFVPGNGSFPDGFRWDELQGCLGGSWLVVCDLRLRRLGLRSGCRSDHARESVDQLSGQPVADLDKGDIRVLWVSSSVFISKLDFTICKGRDDYPTAADYLVTFSIRSPRRGAQFYVYSLSRFDGSELVAPSPVPLEFFRHVTAHLPADYFEEVEINKWDEPQFPVDCLLAFAAIIPYATLPAPRKEFVVQLKIGVATNLEGLRQIMSHPFHPAVQLVFTAGSPFDDSVSLREFLDLMSESQYLRSVDLPPSLRNTLNAAPAGPLMIHGADFKSVDKEMDVNCVLPPKKAMSSSSLHSFAAAVSSTDIYVEFGLYSTLKSRSDCGKLEKFLHLCIQPYLEESSLLERLTIVVRHFDSDGPLDWPRLFKLVKKAFSAQGCKSRALQFLDVSVPGAKVDRIQLWGEVLFPKLLLNYCNKQLRQPVRKGALPFAVKAVNQGNVYHKTTNHVPFDMATANAGLIFYFLKSEIDTVHGLDKDSVACAMATSLAGKKRSAPDPLV
jgi:hypothetical protein